MVEGLQVDQLIPIMPPAPPLSLSLCGSFNQRLSRPSARRRGWVCLFVPVCVFVCMSLSWPISIISNLLHLFSLLLIEPKSEAPVWDSCLFVCVCVMAYVFRTLCSSQSQISQCCIVDLCLCSARRHNYRKTRCKQGKVCVYVRARVCVHNCICLLSFLFVCVFWVWTNSLAFSGS